VGAPVIGITAGELVATYGVWKENASIVPADYVHVVAKAGGVPVVLAPSPGAAEALVGRIDGLLLTGGVDMDAALYGEVRHPKTQPPDRVRDDFELALLDAAAARGIPVLGICRGIQVVNVWRGGTLHQHLPDVVHHREHMAVPGTYTDHPVRVETASRLGLILGRTDVEVPGHHHQAPDRIGTGLVASAWAQDGTVEGLEDPASRFLVAVQWHPEVGGDPSLFDALVTAARGAEIPSGA
jgi:putative glutamine amidotransferase